MSGDSHTGFNSAAFTGGALTGAGLLGGALGAGLQAVVQANKEACARWNREQLETAYNLSEVLRFNAVHRAEKSEAELAQLKRLLRKRTVGR